MIDLLPLTLEGNEPVEWQGETPQLRWRARQRNRAD
jgi:succinylglutamate desuccinylase